VSGSTVLVLSLGGWLVVTVVASPYRAITVGWFVSFATLVLLPALLATRDPEVRHTVSRTWIAVAAVLGAYALVEAFVLQANPLFDALYANGPRGELVQKWSIYRATTSLGHPISNGGFFAIAVPLALGAALRHRSGPAAAAAVLAAGGVVASGSRGALAAMLAGAAVVVLRPTPGVSRSAGAAAGKALGVMALVATLVLGAAYLAARDASGEGADSAAFRVTQVPVALQSVATSPVFGTGPGAASYSQESLLSRIGGAGAFESFWLELVVGAGVPGLLLGAAVLRRRRPPRCAAGLRRSPAPWSRGR
jgi:O-antigen ligase